MVFPVVMFRCESWTIKKAACQRIDAFELCCWRRLLKVPWTARRKNQSILDEINKELKPGNPRGNKPWIFTGKTAVETEAPILWPLVVKRGFIGKKKKNKKPWCWERLRAGGEGEDRGWDGWMALPTQWTRVSVISGSWWWTGRPDMLQFMGSQRVGHDWMTELKWKWSRSVVSDSVTPRTVAHQAPPSMEFSRQEYWSGLPCPSPGDLPDPGIEPRSPALQADALLPEPPRKLKGDSVSLII